MTCTCLALYQKHFTLHSVIQSFTHTNPHGDGGLNSSHSGHRSNLPLDAFFLGQSHREETLAQTQNTTDEQRVIARPGILRNLSTWASKCFCGKKKLHKNSYTVKVLIFISAWKFIHFCFPTLFNLTQCFSTPALTDDCPGCFRHFPAATRLTGTSGWCSHLNQVFWIRDTSKIHRAVIPEDWNRETIKAAFTD